MAVSTFEKNKHLLSRAGFGIQFHQIADLSKKSTEEFWSQMNSKKSLKPISIVSPEDNLDYTTLAKMDANSKKEKLHKNREQNIGLNLKFFNEMVNSENQLQEKMAFFWNGHFATRVINSQFNQDLLNIVRENALGNFGDLLKAVSKSPAMLQFLNNQQNKKDHPNENFAREVMELFTMGRGNYTEKDVKEGARAFTGWGFQKNGVFFARPFLHDSGSKTFLGKTGNFNGDEALDIILSQKATAKFITRKIYKFFVNESIDESIVADLSEKFYASNYDIKKLMTNIFTSTWFYDQKNIGAKIKSPIELMAGIIRILPTKIENAKGLIVYQKLLGQMLLYPPNVAGWPSGEAWIDSSTLFLRMQLPQIWSGLRPLDVQPKADDDLEMGMGNIVQKNKNTVNDNFTIDWPKVEAEFKGRNVADILLQKKMNGDGKYIDQFSDGSIKMTIINIMSVPEFQLC
ncbi:DUF1800 domain-containing protein [Halpernia frigidisoli]|uniref:DUF1800 domain-containing protein n=1 Tax=Halpernia frigidisoli TaxID=1125876 RepID=A0A1I3ILX5_9FLAO|nr:DUF1800 domain-containing protein [Halpernia frigidisoli]SFI48837.1 Protein of unknown function [Halpernia frigidisoli]